MNEDFTPETEKLFYLVFEKDLIQNSIRQLTGELTPSAKERIFRFNRQSNSGEQND